MDARDWIWYIGSCVIATLAIFASLFLVMGVLLGFPAPPSEVFAIGVFLSVGFTAFLGFNIILQEF